MRYRFGRIPELEYRLILDRSFCQEVMITEDGMNCELLGRKRFQKEFEKNIAEACHETEDLTRAFEELLTKRDKMLKKLAQYAPEIYPFADEEETGEAEDISPDETTGTEDMIKEIPLEDVGEEVQGGDTCINVVASNNKVFEEPIRAYLGKYTKICDLFFKSSFKNRDHLLELISKLANLDIVAVRRQDLVGCLLIALNISPQRLALAMNSDAVADTKRSDVYYVPPVVGRRLDGKSVIFHAYRSVDDYPVLFPGINMEEKEIGGDRESKFRQEIADATKILYRLKRGRRAVRFPLSELSKIIEIYLSTFSVSRDRLALVDLGTGRGGLLKAIVYRFLNESASKLLDDRSTWMFVLNDAYEEERTGEEFVRYATTDGPSRFIKEIRKIIGDLGKATKILGAFGADICFINRVLDMYAKYGFYSVNAKQEEIPISAAVEQMEDTEYRGTVLTYKDLICFKDIYNLQRQLFEYEELRRRVVLPGVSYNLKDDFFEPRKSSLEDLVNMSKLVVISAFPATKGTLFAKLLNKEIHVCSIGEYDLSSKPRYIIFCLSKEKELIDNIRKNLQAPKQDC